MDLLELFGTVHTFAFDLDGVLTDGSLLLSEEGHMQRSMNIKDCYALQLAVSKGYSVWVISGGKSIAVCIRLNKLGIREVHEGILNKKDFIQQLAAATDTSLATVLYMGDDIPDYGAMQLCGLAACPNDAVTEIRQVSAYISPANGGKGCVRDVIEKVMKLHGHWDVQ
jgi:3-deoxy-D-manno-octulosonate 8-phosphate phosphatase (KDO 8-P phosphatase)